MKTFLPFLPLLLVAAVASCGADRDTGTPPAVDLPAELFAHSMPADAQPVDAVRGSTTVGAKVVLRGLIGGRAKPFVSGRAMFVVVDPGLEPCPPEEGCATPWDCCCSPSDVIAAHSATVQVAGADGAPLAHDLDGVHDLRPGAMVVVAGVVRATDGGLLVDASAIHVE